MKTLNIIHLVLKLAQSNPAFIIQATNIVDSIGADKVTFPSPSPVLSVVTTHIGDLIAAESAAKNRTKGAVAVRDEKRKVVVSDLQHLLIYVEGVANAHPENADAIAHAASMFVHKKPTRAKKELAVGKHPSSGMVRLVAKAANGGKAHDWQYSLDGKAWTSLPTTLQATTTVALQPGVLAYFRHRVVTKLGATDWGDTITSIVV